jgi:hypothetical protein
MVRSHRLPHLRLGQRQTKAISFAVHSVSSQRYIFICDHGCADSAA